MSAVLLTLIALVAVGGFLYTLYERLRLLLAARPVNHFDRIGERLMAVLVYAFGQKKFVKDEQPAGWMHVVIFWGFVFLGVQVITMFGRAYSDHFVIPGFSPDLLGGLFLLPRDVMEVTVSAAVLLALYRWVIAYPPRLFGYRPAEDRLASQSHWEALVILLFILAIMLSGLLYDGGCLVAFAGDPLVEAERPWEPVSALVGLLLAGLGTN